MRISDWSSDVCSSDLLDGADLHVAPPCGVRRGRARLRAGGDRVGAGGGGTNVVLHRGGSALRCPGQHSAVGTGCPGGGGTQSAAMIPLAGGLRVWLPTVHTDMPKGMQGRSEGRRVGQGVVQQGSSWGRMNTSK